MNLAKLPSWPRLLRHPPSADSITRRLAAIDAAIAKVTGDA